MNTKRLTLTYTYPGLVQRISTPIELFTGGYDETKSVMVNATWDTGAHTTVIDPSLAEKLVIKAIDTALMRAVNSTHRVAIGIASVRFPHGGIIDDMRVIICPITPDTHMLIGMDIISQMDVAICNGNGQTSITFAIPPFQDRIDFEKQS